MGFSCVRGLEGAAGGFRFPFEFVLFLRPLAADRPNPHVPAFDGKACSYANYEEKAILRNQIPTVEPGKRAANLLLQMADIARRKCMAVGDAHITNARRAQRILIILRERFAPVALDAICQEVAKFMNFKRAGQPTDVHLMEFDVLRDKADGQMAMGNGFQDEFVSILCMQNTPLSEMGNPWCWPVFAIRWRFRRRQIKCDDRLVRVEARPVEMYFWPPIWIPCLRKKITSPRRHIARRKKR